MADLYGVALTTKEVSNIVSDIQQISSEIDETMKAVDSTMTTLSGQSEGGVIEKITDAVRDLNMLVETLVACILNIGIKIGQFLDAIVNHDSEAADKIVQSIQSRVYG